MTTNLEERAMELCDVLAIEQTLHDIRAIQEYFTQVQAEAREAALEEAAQYFLSDDYIDNQHGLGGPIDLATFMRDLKHSAQAAAPAKEEG